MDSAEDAKRVHHLQVSRHQRRVSESACSQTDSLPTHSTKLLSCVTGIIGLTIVTLSTSSLQQTLVRNEFTHDTLTVACITRTIYIIPIVIHGYILTFGALQAFLARGDSSFRGEKPGRRLSPAVANTLFIAVGLLFVGGLAAASLYVAINGTHLYGHIILPLQARLAEGAAAWEAGERSASAFAAVLPMLEHAGVKGAHYAK